MLELCNLPTKRGHLHFQPGNVRALVTACRTPASHEEAPLALRRGSGLLGGRQCLSQHRHFATAVRIRLVPALLRQRVEVHQQSRMLPLELRGLRRRDVARRLSLLRTRTNARHLLLEHPAHRRKFAPCASRAFSPVDKVLQFARQRRGLAGSFLALLPLVVCECRRLSPLLFCVRRGIRRLLCPRKRLPLRRLSRLSARPLSRKRRLNFSPGRLDVLQARTKASQLLARRVVRSLDGPHLLLRAPVQLKHLGELGNVPSRLRLHVVGETLHHVLRAPRKGIGGVRGGAQRTSSRFSASFSAYAHDGG